MSFTCASHQYSSSEAIFGSFCRARLGTSPDSEPKGCGEALAVILVLAQPERHRRAGGTFEYSCSRKWKIAEVRSQVPYESSLILPRINIMLDPWACCEVRLKVPVDAVSRQRNGSSARVKSGSGQLTALLRSEGAISAPAPSQKPRNGKTAA